MVEETYQEPLFGKWRKPLLPPEIAVSVKVTALRKKGSRRWAREYSRVIVGAGSQAGESTRMATQR